MVLVTRSDYHAPIPSFFRAHARALTMLAAGVAAGGLTSSAALSPPASVDPRLGVHLAVQAPPDDSATAGLPATDPALLAASIDGGGGEVAVAGHDGEGRSVPPAASRASLHAGSLVWPARGAVTGPFAEPRRSGPHPGLDIDGVVGDPVLAAGAGTVVIAGPAPAGYSGYGTMIAIDHGEGLQTLYAHLSRHDVVPATVVRAGDLIGAIGTTGVVTGSHLHFEVRLAGVQVDPARWLAGR